MPQTNPDSFSSFPSLIQGHAPEEKEIQYSIGPYQVLSSIGKGGMGEVLLAYDTKCGRRVALKKIRADLLSHTQLHKRFLKEARVTSQLTHPAIIPIYTIEDEQNGAYYTMPFVQGETLKQVLRLTRDQEKKGEKLHHIGGSIPALVRIFITVCQAIAYAHAKGVLHRDLKPENIIVGEYGEVLILDWGLAKLMNAPDPEEEELPEPPSHPFHELTRIGKVVGTVNFMAPERARGEPATIQTEIYALGVMLFQLLTLKNPFNRTSLEDFRKNMHQEKLQDPIDVAPYRDVPRLLSRICMKCLHMDPQQRYLSVDELIRELENYIEGRSEWFQIAELDIARKSDWEFQENVLIAEHIAITRAAEFSEWVNLMISKASFTGNTKVEASVTLGNTGHGLGFLMSLPEVAERKYLNEGFCLWLGSDINRATKLLRSNIEVIEAPDIFLQRGRTYRIRIEKLDHNIHFYLNDILQFSYISHRPLAGTHIGLLARDADFNIENFTVFVGSQNIMVNCLAVPDAFLAHKDFATALIEYRRIGYSFPGRAEGREAMFRAGITILEQAAETSRKSEKQKLYETALEEFEKLHSTPGAPLEYLGKAHVYQEMGDTDEEIKCYEIGFRRYPRHPILPILHEQLIFRMHELSRTERKAAYQFMLTAVRHLPNVMENNYTRKLYVGLQKNWEPLPFIKQTAPKLTTNLEIGIQLAFWVANSLALVEFIENMSYENPLPATAISDALFCLIELGACQACRDQMSELSANASLEEFELVEVTLAAHEKSPEAAFKQFLTKKRPALESGQLRTLFHLVETALDNKNVSLVHQILEEMEKYPLDETVKRSVNCHRIWALMVEGQWTKAGELLHQFPLTQLTEETSLLYTLYGCWLAATENKDLALIHFSGILDTPFPRSWTLLGHYLNGKANESSPWFHKAFLWEKRQLYKQLSLFSHCLGDVRAEKSYRQLMLKQRV